jgi:tripartite-type tricarboxylate transporter receptor subunit TctC
MKTTMLTKRLSAHVLVACALLLGVAQTVQARDASSQAFPNHQVHLVVPYPPGGAADVLARLVGKQLGPKWGQAVVVENRPGAGGLVGTDYVARQPPDGYTLLLGATSTHIVGPLINKANFDPFKDFSAITPAVVAPWILVSGPKVPVTSLSGLIALAKSHPGQLNYASYGTGSGNHLAMELLDSMAGIKITHIPYTGSSPSMAALLGGQVDVMFDSLASSLPQIKAGKIRALATSGARRSALTPDVPSVAEAGVPGYDLQAWWGFYAPAGTPATIVVQLNADIVAALRAPGMKESLAELGLETYTSTPDEFVAIERRDLVKWTTLVKAAGITRQ